MISGAQRTWIVTNGTCKHCRCRYMVRISKASLYRMEKRVCLTFGYRMNVRFVARKKTSSQSLRRSDRPLRIVGVDIGILPISRLFLVKHFFALEIVSLLFPYHL